MQFLLLILLVLLINCSIFYLDLESRVDALEGKAILSMFSLSDFEFVNSSMIYFSSIA